MTDTTWSALLLSMKISLAATLATSAVAIPAAYGVSRRPFWGRGVLESILLLPLVLPPTVVGYVILRLLARGGVIGDLLGRLNYSIVFRFEGAVLAGAVVALPMVYLSARAAFGGVERELEEVARTLGASRWQVFWRVSLPLAKRGLASGLILGFARALGEFGATVMVFGWQPGKVTLPIAVYAAYEQGDVGAAWPAVWALMALSVALIAGYNLVLGKRD